MGTATGPTLRSCCRRAVVTNGTGRVPISTIRKGWRRFATKMEKMPARHNVELKALPCHINDAANSAKRRWRSSTSGSDVGHREKAGRSDAALFRPSSSGERSENRGSSGDQVFITFGSGCRAALPRPRHDARRWPLYRQPERRACGRLCLAQFTGVQPVGVLRRALFVFDHSSSMSHLTAERRSSRASSSGSGQASSTR